MPRQGNWEFSNIDDYNAIIKNQYTKILINFEPG